MTRFFRSGNDYTVRVDGAVDIFDQLPAKTFTIKKNDFTGEMYFQVIPDLEVPTKIYGNSPVEKSVRIIRTFIDRYDDSKSTGVLLTGDKGSGKTLLTKVLASEMISIGNPVIIINEPWCGQKFNELIGAIKQQTMVLFDEFEKVYDEDDQKSLLTLLDGTINSSKLFVMTSNSRNINEFLTNRPGRIYYTFEYNGLDIDFVEEYANDKLKNPEHLSSIKAVHSAFSSFTFDMLATLVEEMNRYGEDAFTSIRYLNIDISNETVSYDVKIVYNGEMISNNYHPKYINRNPLYYSHDGRFEVNIYSDTDEDDDVPASSRKSKKSAKKDVILDKYHSVTLTKDHFVGMSDGGTITYQIMIEGKKFYVILSKANRFSFDFRAF
jgi:hypothetical protein